MAKFPMNGGLAQLASHDSTYSRGPVSSCGGCETMNLLTPQILPGSWNPQLVS